MRPPHVREAEAPLIRLGSSTAIIPMAQYDPRLWAIGLDLDMNVPNILMVRLKLGPFALGFDYAWR